jgi:hypothetical protein
VNRFCNLETNRCESARIAGCCDSDDDCPADTECVDHFCDLATNTCDSVRECEQDSDCDDGDPCTDDVCGTDGCCSNQPLSCVDEPCPPECYCDEEGSVCRLCECAGDGETCCTDSDCDDGKTCTTDTCVDNCCTYEPVECPNNQCCRENVGCVDTCDDGVFCNGVEGCDDGQCVDAVALPCPEDDGLFCNGPEGCDEDNDVCVEELPCLEGQECDEETDECFVPCGEDADCPDDGLFCNGPETCVEGRCVSGPPPCGGECDEANDVCGPEPERRCATAADCLENEQCVDGLCEPTQRPGRFFCGIGTPMGMVSSMLGLLGLHFHSKRRRLNRPIIE